MSTAAYQRPYDDPLDSNDSYEQDDSNSDDQIKPQANQNSFYVEQQYAQSKQQNNWVNQKQIPNNQSYSDSAMNHTLNNS